MAAPNVVANLMGPVFRPNILSAPDWRADFGGRQHILAFPAKIDYTQFPDDGAFTLVTSGDIAASSQNEIVSLAVNATGGTYDITVAVNGGAPQTATLVPYNINPNPNQVGFYEWGVQPPSNVTLQQTLEALSNIGAGNVKVNGNVGNFGAGGQIYLLTVEFTGTLKGLPAVITVNSANLTGGGAAVTVTELAAAATSSNTTVIETSPLPDYIYGGTKLQFDNGSYVTVASTANVGSTTLSVLAENAVIPDGSKAVLPRPYGYRTIGSGRLAGRLFTERASSLPFRAWQPGDNEAYLVYDTVWDAVRQNDCEFYRPGSLVIENYLPGYTSLTTAQLTAIRANYQCIVRLNDALL